MRTRGVAARRKAALVHSHFYRSCNERVRSTGLVRKNDSFGATVAACSWTIMSPDCQARGKRQETLKLKTRPSNNYSTI